MNISTNSSINMKKGDPLNFTGKENRNSITPPNNNQRSFSYDQKNDNNKGNQKNEVTKIIISPQIQNVYNHNINNIYIQNPSINSGNDNNNVNFGINDKLKNNGNYNLNNNFHNIGNYNVNNGNYNSYENKRIVNNNNSSQGYNSINRPNSVNKKDDKFSLNNLYSNNQGIENSRSQVINSTNKDLNMNINDKLLNKSLETQQKIMQNNYFNNQNVFK